MQTISLQSILQTYLPDLKTGLLRWHIVLAVFLMGLLSLMLALVLIHCVDTLIAVNEQQNQHLKKDGFEAEFLVAIVIVTMLVFVRLLQGILISRYTAKLDYSLSRLQYLKLLQGKLTTLEQLGYTRIFNSIEAVKAVQSCYPGQILSIVVVVSWVIIYLLLIGWVELSLVFIPLSALGVSLLSLSIFIIKSSRVIPLAYSTAQIFYDHLINLLHGWYTAKALYLSTQLKIRYETCYANKVEQQVTVNQCLANLHSNLSLIMKLLIVACSAYGAILLVKQQITLGGLIGCIFLAICSLHSISLIAFFCESRQRIKYELSSIKSLLEVPTVKSSVKQTALQIIQGRIDCNKVSFRYSEENAWVLYQVSLHINPGELVVLSSENGSGKSTLLGILKGIIQPDQGEVLLDGKPLGSFNDDVLIQQVVYLPQKAALFSGTIMENLTLFSTAKEVLAIEAAKTLNIADAIAQLPDGFYTLIDAEQHQLPQGLVQRIAFARAIVCQPKVLLVDDANSAVDLKGDQAIIRLLKQLKGITTMVVASHRPSIIRLADHVFELNKGHLLRETLLLQQ
ncbi:ATP-binding cassette domain-containing protein [Zooshikella marina]|uniref:ATP-binding cassette domain-containing protein n=1 Tax=Zooshikella ganghwensis TaxID=202772 RepID=UPI001BB0A189|nr:ATP-binding cassette domain-containing protein [Zooshikella ganghwensis]MBU2708906.1 ATP-binding cassette domain-containing protein [Zooshikella ganghwensis]